MNKLSRFAAIVVTAAVSLAFYGCNGGGGNSSTGGVYFTHSELARDFVYRLQVDLGYDVELVKTNTEQYDYIVVYDWDLDSYDAYYLGNYNPGEDLDDYLWDYDDTFYYELWDIGGNRYEDPWSGLIFNENMDIPRDTMKIEAVKQMDFIDVAASKLVQSYGVSMETAQKITQAGLMVSAGQKRGVGESYYQNLLQQLTGTDLGQWRNAILSGDQSELDNLTATTANTLGMHPSDANRVMKRLFSGN